MRKKGTEWIRGTFRVVLLGILMTMAVANYALASQEIQVITGFGDFALPGHSLEVNYDNRMPETDLVACMPATLAVYLDDSTTAVEIPVTWYCSTGDYANTEDFYVSFYPAWDESRYLLSGTIDQGSQIPFVGVFFRQADAASEEGQVQMTDNGLSIAAPVEVSTDQAAYAGYDSVIPSDNMKTCYKYFTNTMGLNVAMTCGILANLQIESGFNPKATSSSGYYGLAQWDPKSRKERLKTYCSNHSLDYTTVKGQLAFMKYEVSSYAPSYYKYDLMKNNVSNSPLGCVYGCWIWSHYYEGCAYTNRGKRQDLSRLFWEYFTSTSYISPAVTISKSGVTFPDKVGKKDKLAFSGTVKCSQDMDSLTICVARYVKYSSSTTSTEAAIPVGTWVDSPKGITVKPGSDRYDLSSITSTWSFSELSTGTYTFCITAYVDGYGYTVLEKTFSVVSGTVIGTDIGTGKTEEKETEAPETTPQTTEAASEVVVVIPDAPKATSTYAIGGLTVKWSAVMGAQSYNIYRKSSSSSSYKKIATVSASKLSYTDTSVSNATTYTYGVTAVCKEGETVKGTTTRRYISDITPTVSNSSSGVKVSWTSLAGVSGYDVWKKNEDGSYEKLARVTSSTQSYIDTTAVDQTVYNYAVSGYYGSYRSYRICATIKYYKAFYPTVTNTAKGINISWKQVPGATYYKVYRKAEGGSYTRIATIDDPETLSYLDEIVVRDNGAMYTYAVRAYDGTYSSYYKGKKYYRVTGLTLSGLINVSTLSMQVNWFRNPHATGYQIQIATDADFTANKKTYTVTGASTLTKTIRELTKNTTYYVRIRAYIKDGTKNYYSCWTDIASVKIAK